MSKNSALYAGTFDPFTNGHWDIVQRALKIFDQVVILVAVSPSKKPFLTQSKRVEILRKVFKNEKRIKVEAWEGLVVDYAKKNNIQFIVRGLRPTGDFEIEFQMASMNRKLSHKLDTVFLMTSEKNFYVSSTLIREIYFHGGDIEEFVPVEVFKELKKIKRE